MDKALKLLTILSVIFTLMVARQLCAQSLVPVPEGTSGGGRSFPSADTYGQIESQDDFQGRPLPPGPMSQEYEDLGPIGADREILRNSNEINGYGGRRRIRPIPVMENLRARVRAHDGRMTLNPLAVQQGVGDFAFRGDEALSHQRLGFPFTIIPQRLVDHFPKIEINLNLPRGRHVEGREPLIGTSWKNRPFYFDVFSGGLFGSKLKSGTAQQGNGVIYGGRLGWDAHHHLATEFRFSRANTLLVGQSNRAQLRFYDISVLYYPWGDTMFRPYTGLGLGVADFVFVDTQGTSIQEKTVNLPLSIGFKYFFQHWLSLRVDLTDNIAFGSNVVNSMQNVSLTGGFELRYGGRRKKYTSSRGPF